MRSPSVEEFFDRRGQPLMGWRTARGHDRERRLGNHIHWATEGRVVMLFGICRLKVLAALVPAGSEITSRSGTFVEKEFSNIFTGEDMPPHMSF